MRPPRQLGRRAVLAGALASPAIAHAQENPATLRDLARRATIYLFPVYEMYRSRWRATVDETNPQRQRLNSLRHLAELADHRVREASAPSADMHHSLAWLDRAVHQLIR